MVSGAAARLTLPSWNLVDVESGLLSQRGSSPPRSGSRRSTWRGTSEPARPRTSVLAVRRGRGLVLQSSDHDGDIVFAAPIERELDQPLT